MNTNSNVYTVIYTAVVVVLVAAVLAIVSGKLGPMQAANEKAENIGQILTAAQFGEKEHWQEIGNAATIKFFEENIDGDANVLTISDLKAINYKIKAGEDISFPVYKFKNGVSALPVYGAGLWGPVWGYVAVAQDGVSIVGAYFDHASETPGLGGKIKDDPAFRAQFKGEVINTAADCDAFNIVKGGSEKGNLTDSKVDAITGATMTSRGLEAAINAWLKEYVKSIPATAEETAGTESTEEETSNE